jgi:hypothetical protein
MCWIFLPRVNKFKTNIKKVHTLHKLIYICAYHLDPHMN